MNLRQIANRSTSAINPNIPATLKRSNGYKTDDAGQRTPIYETLSGTVQVQAMSAGDLQHTENLNIQGVLRAVYINGNWVGVVRGDAKGGDVLQFAKSNHGAVHNWLVVSVVESWTEWTKVIVCLQ
jgi:hypothetical protein